MATRTEERSGIEEQYAASVGSSNLRVGNDSSIRTPGDMIAAAGMNKHRMGLALRRLMHEWDKSAKPKRLSDEQIDALAKAQKAEDQELHIPVQMTDEQRLQAIAKYGLDPRKFVSVAVVTAPNPHVGLVKCDDGGKASYLNPRAAAQREADRWYANELQILLLGLKTLPQIRDALIFHCRSNGWEGDAHLVAAVLQWWLDPKCPVCHGRKLKVVAGTGRTGSKACPACKPHPGALEGTGERKLPHGWRGLKLLAHIRHCLTSAAQDLSQGTFRHQRSQRNEADRLHAKLQASGQPMPKLPAKVPARRYSPYGKFHDGDYVTRRGDDVHQATDMDRDGYCAVFVCVVAPADGWCEVGSRELNLCRRYSRVDYAAPS